jgi:hypothetical protein
VKKIGIMAYLFICVTAFSYESFEGDIEDTWLSVYSNNITLVREKRYLNIEGETENLMLKGLPKYVDIGSLNLKGVDVKSVNYNSNLLDSYKLLENYIGKKIFLDDTAAREEVKLLSVAPKIIVETASGEILVDPKKEIFLPKLEAEPLLYPSLIVKTEKIDKATELETSYLTNGIYWQFNYKFDLENKNLETWVELRNNSGKNFKDTHLKLISGDMNGSYLRGQAKAYLMEAASLGEFSQWNDYMVYEFDKVVTLMDSNVEYVKLTQDRVDYEKYYEHRFNSFSKNPSINIRFKNTLGRVLARGRVSFYDGVDYLGEGNLDYLNESEKADIGIARSFEVRVESKIDSSVMLSKKIYKKGVVYNLKNNRDEKVKLELIYDNLPASWTELQSEQPYEKVSERSIVFKIDMAPGEEKAFRFSYIEEN